MSAARAASGERRVLDEARGVRAMTWVIAIMLFLTVLAAAAGLATANVRATLAQQLAGRLTIQLIDGDPTTRDRRTARILAMLRGSPQVAAVREIGRAELARLLRPWLGEDGADPELPMPAMIDADLKPGIDPAATAAHVHALAPDARIDRHESWMSPVTGVMASVTWLAAGLVVLMASATAAVVMLAARAGLESHRATIEVMHMLGSTDRQLARLFQRRIALDALVGGGVGSVAALGTIALVGQRLAALGSELLGTVTLTIADWCFLAALPFAFVVLALLAARVALLAALRQIV